MQASLLFSASALSVVFQPREVHGSWQQLLLMCSGFLLKSPLISSQALSQALQPWLPGLASTKAAWAPQVQQDSSGAAGEHLTPTPAQPGLPWCLPWCHSCTHSVTLGWALHRAQHIPTPELLGSSAGCAGAQLRVGLEPSSCQSQAVSHLSDVLVVEVFFPGKGRNAKATVISCCTAKLENS